LIDDESQDQPTDETPTPDEENVEPTAAPDEGPEVPSAESPADVPAESDDITQVPEEGEPQPDQAEGEPEDVPAAAEREPEAEAPPAAEPDAEATAAAQERPRPRREERRPEEPEVIPGAHLEPDLVLEQQASAETEGDEYAQYAEEVEEEAETTPEPEAPAIRSPLELAADARYQATGKRKTAIARVILKPGSGVYTINGRTLEQYFPRDRLQTQARQPLDATGNLARMDVVARIHGGGVSAQAGALRHGIARALVEAEPTLRTELKRRGYLTRDPREKERKKAGLKKARKRPQFSKR
jgi:small subunit ribosomal protein S9